MVVRDKRNKPVVDLTPADIAVSDAGNPIQLTNLHLVTAQTGGLASIIVLFDRMSPESARAAREIAARILSIAPDRSFFAVLSLDERLRLLQSFTRDRAAAEKAAGLASGQPSNQGAAEAEKQLISIAQTGSSPSAVYATVDDHTKAKMMLDALEESQRIVQDQHAQPALAGLLALAKAEQNLAGRKIIVLFSEGIYANSSTEDISREVVAASDRAGIGIYTVETGAMDTGSFSSLSKVYKDTSMGNFGQNNMTNVPGALGNLDRMGSEIDVRNARNDPLVLLANGTGGFSLRAADNLNKPLQRLVDDVATYYEAYYVPVLKVYDGQFHSIEIKPLRAKMTIRARAGYFALPPEASASFTLRPFEAPLLKVLSGVELPTDVSFKQAVLRLGGNSSRTENELAIEVPVSGLEVHQDQRTQLYSIHLSILAQVKDKSGVIVERFSEDISRNGALETLASARDGVMTLQRHFNAAPGSYLLEAAVLDSIGGRVGAQRTAFTAPSPVERPWLSDIALVRRTEPVDGAQDPLDPMLYGKERVVPNLSEQVPAGSPQISFFFRMHADVTLAGTGGKLDLEVQQDGKTVSHLSTGVAHGANLEDTLNLASVPARSLPPGTYRALFTYTQGNKTSTRDLAFTVSNPTSGDGPSKTQSDSQDASPKAATRDSTAAYRNDDTGQQTKIASSAGATLSSTLPALAPGRYTAVALSNSSPQATKSHLDALLAGARERSLAYVDSLVNFECIEITDRFIDAKGTGTWTHRDRIVELATFENKLESRKLLQVNGRPGNTQEIDMKGGRLEGEFGAVLKIVFDPVSQAAFQWKETGSLEGSAVQVFSYQVDLKKSNFTLTASSSSLITVGFQGLVYIDDATRGVRHIDMQAEGIPADFPIRASGLSIDYDYVAIGNHDYLLPVRGGLRMKLGKRQEILHRIEFRDYRRFGSEIRIVEAKH